MHPDTHLKNDWVETFCAKPPDQVRRCCRAGRRDRAQTLYAFEIQGSCFSKACLEKRLPDAEAFGISPSDQDLPDFVVSPQGIDPALHINPNVHNEFMISIPGVEILGRRKTKSRCNVTCLQSILRCRSAKRLCWEEWRFKERAAKRIPKTCRSPTTGILKSQYTMP